SSTADRETYPNALGLAATAAITPPVLVSSCSYTQASSTPTILSKPSLVPLPASRPTRTTGASGPPTSLQLVISPVASALMLSRVRSVTVLSGCTTMAIPSSANVVATRPCPVSSS